MKRFKKIENITSKCRENGSLHLDISNSETESWTIWVTKAEMEIGKGLQSFHTG